MSEEAIGGEAAVAPTEAPAEATESSVEEEATEVEVDEGPKSLDDLEPNETTEVDTQEASDDSDDEGEDSADEAVEMREYDFGGNKLEIPIDSVPAELADMIEAFTKSTYADYQKKSQANADTAKNLAAREDAVGKITQLNGDALQTYSSGLQLRSEIEQLKAIDIQSLWQSNPDQARRLSDTISKKQADFQNIVALVGQQEQALDAAQQTEIVRRRDAGVSTLDKKYSNFSTEKAPEVVKYAMEVGGMTQAEANGWPLNPKVTEFAYKAMLYDRMQSKAKTPSSKPTQARPVASIKSRGNAAGTSDPDKMSMSQLNKHLGLAS